MSGPDSIASDSKAPRAPVGWALAIAGLTAAGATLRFLNPYTGKAAHRWPWQVPSPLLWTRDLATQVFFLAMTILPFVALFLPAGRRRGVLVLAVSALSLTALADIGQYLYGVDTYIPPLLGAVVAAGLYGSRTAGGGGRRVAGLAGAALLALLLYPQGSATPANARQPGTAGEYHAVLPALIGELVARSAVTDESRQAAVGAGVLSADATAFEMATAPYPMAILLSTVLGLFGLLGAFLRPRRWIAWGAFVTFLAATAYPPVWYGAFAFLHPERADPSNLSAAGAAAVEVAHSFREQYAPFLLAIFAAVVDLARPPEPANP